MKSRLDPIDSHNTTGQKYMRHCAKNTYTGDIGRLKKSKHYVVVVRVWGATPMSVVHSLPLHFCGHIVELPRIRLDSRTSGTRAGGDYVWNA